MHETVIFYNSLKKKPNTWLSLSFFFSNTDLNKYPTQSNCLLDKQGRKGKETGQHTQRPRERETKRQKKQRAFSSCCPLQTQLSLSSHATWSQLWASLSWFHDSSHTIHLTLPPKIPGKLKVKTLSPCLVACVQELKSPIGTSAAWESSCYFTKPSQH